MDLVVWWSGGLVLAVFRAGRDAPWRSLEGGEGARVANRRRCEVEAAHANRMGQEPASF